jgi:hypothetical protein
MNGNTSQRPAPLVPLGAAFVESVAPHLAQKRAEELDDLAAQLGQIIMFTATIFVCDPAWKTRSDMR